MLLFNRLLVDDVLPYEHGVLLQLVYVQKEFLVDVFAEAHLAVELLDLLGHELYHIRIQVNSLLEYADEDDISGRIEFREGQQPALKVGQTPQRTFPEGHEDIVRKDEGDRLHRIFLRSRDQEVRIGENSRVGFGKA